MKSITITLTTNDDSVDLVDLVKSQYEGSKVINSYTIEEVKTPTESRETIFSTLNKYLEENSNLSQGKLVTKLYKDFDLSLGESLKTVDAWIESTSGLLWKEEWDNFGNLIDRYVEKK